MRVAGLTVPSIVARSSTAAPRLRSRSTVNPVDAVLRRRSRIAGLPDGSTPRRGLARIERATAHGAHRFVRSRPFAQDLSLRPERRAPRGSAAAAAREVRSHRPPEIVWRRSSYAIGSAVAHVRPPVEVQSVVSRVWPSAAPTQEAEARPTATPQRTSPLQFGDLDASLLDRLTDDVIRRVERRVRIERERRGL
jgi:hypothetical protein